MLRCPACSSFNQDNATVCSVCRGPLLAAKGQAGSTAAPRNKTLVEGVSIPTPPRVTVVENTPPIAPSGLGMKAARQPTVDLQAQPVASRTKTVFAGAVPESVSNVGALKSVVAAGRKIVGLLVTFTWNENGEIYPVYEGRNYIGRDSGKCEIAVPQDETLSSVNSHIIFRKSFTIGDDVSMSGTDVDGEPVETPFVPLRNYAAIRTGSTHWTFIAIQPQTEEGQAS